MATKKMTEETFLPEGLQLVEDEVEEVEQVSVSTDIKVKYTGSNASFTIDRVRLKKGDIAVFSEDLANLALKNSEFTKVEGDIIV